tara:strand:+ start:302 stop:631 length:330 start_codon:yes stop_codon:yes gene_type:complete
MSNLWRILDADGNTTNECIKAEEAWVKENFEHYEAFTIKEWTGDLLQPPPKDEDPEFMRMWRNSELARTDSLVGLPDHPDKDKFIAYRQALRDWPSTSDFPNTRPTLGS